MRLEMILIAALVIWNIIVMLLYGIDKLKAAKGKWRVSESTLILCAFLGGSVGSLLGMSFFRHKTQKPKFKILVPIAFVLHIAIIVFFFFPI